MFYSAILCLKYNNLFPLESAGDKHIIACEDLRVIISRSDQEICFNALNDRRKAVSIFITFTYEVLLATKSVAPAEAEGRHPFGSNIEEGHISLAPAVF